MKNILYILLFILNISFCVAETVNVQVLRTETKGERFLRVYVKVTNLTNKPIVYKESECGFASFPEVSCEDTDCQIECALPINSFPEDETIILNPKESNEFCLITAYIHGGKKGKHKLTLKFRNKIFPPAKFEIEIKKDLSYGWKCFDGKNMIFDD